jgi:Ca2+-binding RTX toxin-like protein
LNAVTNLDHIADFAAGTDKVGLSSTIFGLLPNTLSSTNLETVHGNVLGTTGANLVYDADSGTLYYDANGASAAGGRTAFVVFDNHAVVHVGDFFMF